MPIAAAVGTASATTGLELFAYRDTADAVAVTDGCNGPRQDKRQFARVLESLHFVAWRVHESAIVALAASVLKIAWIRAG